MANKKAAAAIAHAGKPTDPVFLALVDHAESAKTSDSITSLRSIMQRLGADSLHVDVDKAACTFKVTVDVGTKRYTSTTDWGTNDTTIRIFNMAWGDNGLLEDLTLTDSYSTKIGPLVANGHWTGGE